MGSINILKPLPTFLEPAPLINQSNYGNFSTEKFWKRWGSNSGLLDEEQVCYLCALQPNLTSNVYFFLRRDSPDCNSCSRASGCPDVDNVLRVDRQPGPGRRAQVSAASGEVPSSGQQRRPLRRRLSQRRSLLLIRGLSVTP